MGNYSYQVEQTSQQGRDRVTVVEINGYIILLLADGAGQSQEAGQLAEQYIEQMTAKIKEGAISKDPMLIEQMMREVDLTLSGSSNGSESTAIIAVIKDTEVWGAGVGDSQCWIFNDEFEYELTKNQYRKPMLGSGQAIPVGFGPVLLDGFIVVGSDGLFNYTTIECIRGKLSSIEFNQIPKSLIDLVRLPSGALQDDCSVIVYQA